MPKCPQCGNEDFTGIDTSAPYICPIPGCGAALRPNNTESVQIHTGLMPGMGWLKQSSAARGPAIRQENPSGLRFADDGQGGAAVIGCAGEPETLDIPAVWQNRPVTDIRPEALRGHAALRRVSIPDSVRVIGSGAFMECRNLQAVTVGSGIMRVDDDAFAGCVALREFACAATPGYTSPRAFSGCYELPADVYDALVRRDLEE